MSVSAMSKEKRRRRQQQEKIWFLLNMTRRPPNVFSYSDSMILALAGVLCSIRENYRRYLSAPVSRQINRKSIHDRGMMRADIFANSRSDLVNSMARYWLTWALFENPS
jgi:hypothetical protein